MPLQFAEKSDGKFFEVQASGKLSHADYERFVPEFERLAQQHGKIRMLFDLLDFHGWEFDAAWDDLKFGLKHSSDLERIALVGDRKWEKALAVFWRPFTKASLRYFDRSEAAAAHAWLETD